MHNSVRAEECGEGEIHYYVASVNAELIALSDRMNIIRAYSSSVLKNVWVKCFFILLLKAHCLTFEGLYRHGMEYEKCILCMFLVR